MIYQDIEEKHGKKRKKDEKLEKVKQQQYFFFTFPFSYRKNYILLEHIFRKTLYCYFFMTVFSRGSLLEMQ